MMSVKSEGKSLFPKAARLATGAALALFGAALAGAQAGDLPSAPNPSSLANPYYGSVTLLPATDEVVKLSLDEAVQRGLKCNLGLKQAEDQERTLRSQVTEAIQFFLPSVTVSGGPAVHEYNLAALGFGPGFLKKISAAMPGRDLSGIHLITKSDVTTGQINYEQTLISAPIFEGYGAVRASEKSAYFARMTARGEVVQQVATAYLQVIAAASEVENAKSLLETDRVLLDQAHAKHEAGVVANLDELRARVQFQQQQQTVLANENKRAKAEILLKREIGIPPGQKIELSDPAPYSELPAMTPEQLRTEAYANRQDFQNLQAQERAARLLLGSRRAERLPSLSFKGNYGVTGVTGVGYHGTLSAIGTLTFPIFREASLRGDADVARAQLEGVNRQLQDAKGRIDQQVRSALLDEQAALELVTVARSNVGLAENTLLDESDRFKAGIDDTLPLVQAQSTLASAQSNLVESLYRFNLAKLALARSAGVLEQQYKAYLGN